MKPKSFTRNYSKETGRLTSDAYAAANPDKVFKRNHVVRKAVVVYEKKSPPRCME